jgi:hypothetical protein
MGYYRWPHDGCWVGVEHSLWADNRRLRSWGCSHQPAQSILGNPSAGYLGFASTRHVWLCDNDDDLTYPVYRDNSLSIAVLKFGFILCKWVV